MGQIASSWGAGKIPDAEVIVFKRRKDRGRDRSKELVACAECADGVLRPRGAHGLCKRHAALWRRKHLKGRCSVCRDPEMRQLSTVDPPVCVACYGRQRRAALTPAQIEEDRRKDREYAAAYRQRHPGQSTQRERRMRDEEPERYAAMLARRVARRKVESATETPAQRALRLAARKARGKALADAGTHYRSRLNQAPPPPTRVRALSPHLAEAPEVETRPLPVVNGFFAAALAARREENRPAKKYRRRPAA